MQLLTNVILFFIPEVIFKLMLHFIFKFCSSWLHLLSLPFLFILVISFEVDIHTFLFQLWLAMLLLLGLFFMSKLKSLNLCLTMSLGHFY